MHFWLLTASLLAFLVGLIHSVLGERLIFRHLRQHGVFPYLPAPPLSTRHIRIIWASWHIATVMGWAFALLLFQMAQAESTPTKHSIIVLTASAYFICGLLVLLGTKAKHPGWIGLLLIAFICFLT